MASKMSYPKVEGRTMAWDSLKITILWAADKPPVSLDECELIKPIAMQFALLSKSRRETLLHKLRDKRIELSERNISNGHLELTVTTQLKREDEVKNQTVKTQLKEEDVVKNHVVGALIESLKDIEWFEIDKKTIDYHPVRSEISKVSGTADSDRLILFDGKDAMYVVGESTDIKRCKEQMKVEQSLLTKYKWANLKKLKIEEYFNSKKKVKVIETGNAVKVRGSFCEAEEASKEINLFCDKICKMPVNFDRKDLDLLFLENGDLNFAVLDLFRKSLEEKHVKSFIEIDEAEHLYVYYLDKKEFRRSKEVINGCIISHTAAISVYNAIKPLLEEYKNKMKVIIGDKTVKLVCTNDVPFTELIEPEDISLPQIVIEFLAGYGRENLNMIEKNNGVIVTIDKENLVLRINGKIENRKKFKRYLKESKCIDTFPLEVCSSLVKKHEDELQKIAKSHKCCLQARFLNESAFLSKDCKKVVNWKYVRRCPNVSLIVGQIKDLKTAYKVLFVTDKLCPLHKCDPSSDEYENNIEQLEKMEKGIVNLGEVIDYNGQKEEGCQTKAIVIAKANAEDAFQCKKLKQPIQKIFTEVTDKKAQSIAIQISLYYENLSMKELVELCLSVILSHHAELEVYLVCHPSEEVNQVAQTIDSIYQKKGPGFYRENHTQDISLKNSFRSIKTEVKKQSLVDIEVDVIVNTIGITLDFDGGQLSKIISRKAGRSIVEECRINYPKGIESGSLAITGPGFLKRNVKHIFHCALPIFKKSTFVKDVKEMVRRCLLEMEMRKLKTVAFPAFGTGKLGYPKRETAKAMFDAVEEYQYSCIKSSVESVVFALHVRDIDTCDIFCDEEKRRKQKKQEKKYIAGEKSNFPELHTTIGQNEWQVRLIVASEEDLKQLTSNVVLAEFKFVKEGGDCELKYSSKSPATKNDILKVFVANNVDAKDTELSDAIGKLMKYCKENKIAELVIPTNNGLTIPAEKQLEILVKKVEEHAKSENTLHLCKVYVSLPSCESLDDVKKRLTQSLWSTVRGYLPSTRFFNTGVFSTPAWSRSDQTTVEIKIIGCSKELIEQAKEQLQNYACKLHEQNKQDNDGGNTDKTEISKKQSGNDGEECIIGGDECIINEDDSVTAELNPGIVSYLKDQQTFDTWTNEIMNSYKVGFHKRAGGIEVCGSFTSILSLEKYLDGYFSQDEGQDERKNGLKDKDEGSTLQNDEQKKKQDEWQDEDEDIWQGKEHGKLKEIIPTYTLAGMDIVITERKLTDLKVDCIVVPTNERLEIVGFDDVKHLAGNEYKEACGIDFSAYGKAILSECRMTDAGKLLCSKVLHFMEPSWRKDTWSQSLKVLQDSIVKCLETADKSLFSTIAIPVIYSGKKRFSKNEGQAYVAALSAFSKYRKHISKVFISVQDKSKQEVVMKALIDDVGSEKEAEGLATRPVETSFSIDYPCKNGLVRICSKVGEVHADYVCAVVSEAVDIPSLRSKKSSVGSVIESKVKGVNLNCRYVLQTVIPRRNKKYTQSTGKFEDDIKQTVVNVLNEATNLECRSVALPLMGMSEDPLIPTPLETCCSAMLKGITTFLRNSNLNLDQIDIVDTSTDVARKLRNELQKIKPKEGIV